MKSFSSYLTELRNPKEIGQFRRDVKGIDKVDTRDQSWSRTLPQLMSKFGFKLLGTGKYAHVYGKKGYKYVIKVFMKDSAYMRWVKFSLDNKKNPYTPVIRGKVVKITPMFYAIRLENLTPYRPGSSTKYFNGEYSKFRANSSYRPENDPDLSAVFDHFAKNKRLLDLHGENMMMRGNQVVVVDPYYNWFNKHNPMDYTIDPDDIDKSIF